MPPTHRRLQVLSVLLAGFAVVVAIWALSAFRFALTTRDWPSAQGRVIQPDPAKDAAAVRYTDSAGHQHLMALHTADTDDLPVGSVIRIVYHVEPDGLVRNEFGLQPGARTSALTVLALAAAVGAGVTGWRSRTVRH